jgi:GNAT superfamily N-acetyltransferase
MTDTPYVQPADLTVRLAADSDTPLLAAWTTDELTQEWCGDEVWLHQVLDQETPYVFELDGRVVALITGDIYDQYMVSLTLVVDPAVRGRGIGRAALTRIIEDRVFADRELRAEISWRNRASIATVMHVHFTEDEPDLEVRHSMWGRVADQQEAVQHFNRWSERNTPTEEDWMLDDGESWDA